MNYFKNLPVISYNNNLAVNIMSRAKISDEMKSDSGMFFPYTLEDGDRADNVSTAYYDSPGYTWLVWMSNEVVDPYFDLGVSDSDLYEVIRQKYGSLEKAQRTPAFYRTNGGDDDRIITPTEYAQLPFSRQKYWSPQLDYLLNTKGYERNRDPQIINTNRIVQIVVDEQTAPFVVGEEVQRNGSNYGFVTSNIDNVVTIQHVTGSFPAESIITGRQSNSSAIVITSQTIMSTLADTDSEYWSPVSQYQYEIETNNIKREILLVGNQFKRDVEQQLKRVLNQ